MILSTILSVSVAGDMGYVLMVVAGLVGVAGITTSLFFIGKSDEAHIEILPTGVRGAF